MIDDTWRWKKANWLTHLNWILILAYVMTLSHFWHHDKVFHMVQSMFITLYNVLLNSRHVSCGCYLGREPHSRPVSSMLWDECMCDTSCWQATLHVDCTSPDGLTNAVGAKTSSITCLLDTCQYAAKGHPPAFKFERSDSRVHLTVWAAVCGNGLIILGLTFSMGM